jgi:hypothetical protein
MHEFTDVTDFFINTIDTLKRKVISLHSPLEEIVLKGSGGNLAYVDNHRDAKQKYGYDFWAGLHPDWLKSQGVEERLLYSESGQFPDFLFKLRKDDTELACGSLLELKDSKGGNIASFNSTLPTKYKSLQEIDGINGSNLVSRIASIKDEKLAKEEGFHTHQRKCFYLVRTHADSKRMKISVVDGAFFETVPKEHLIYQVFLNVLHTHLEKKDVELAPEALKQIEEALSYVTDQTIIASSQVIEKASVRPRLRIMAEVHSEGNPHSSFYPEISEGSFNLILQATPLIGKLEKELCSKIPEIKVFSIQHKRNGEHIVFEFKP